MSASPFLTIAIVFRGSIPEVTEEFNAWLATYGDRIWRKPDGEVLMTHSLTCTMPWAVIFVVVTLQREKLSPDELEELQRMGTVPA